MWLTLCECETASTDLKDDRPKNYRSKFNLNLKLIIQTDNDYIGQFTSIEV